MEIYHFSDDNEGLPNRSDFFDEMWYFKNS